MSGDKQPPVAKLDPDAQWLPDLDSAVSEAIQRSGRVSGNDNERSGVIYRNGDGNFAPSIPLASARHDAFALRAEAKDGHAVAAVWHSHPGKDELAGFF